MNLSSLLTSITTTLATALPTWDVSGETIPYAKDKLLEVRYGQVSIGYLDFDTTSYTGNIELAFYKEFKSSYVDLITAVETATLTLQSMSIQDVTIGGQGSILGTAQRPSIVAQETESYYEITVTVPFELLNP